ncbi:hypothetical protein DFQ29_000722, partial [Apophysomyces sp. BC1021]
SNGEDSFTLIVPAIYPGFMKYSGYTLAMRYLSFVSLAVVSVALHVDDMLGSIGSFRPNSLHRAQRVKELMEKFIEET